MKSKALKFAADMCTPCQQFSRVIYLSPYMGNPGGIFKIKLWAINFIP